MLLTDWKTESKAPAIYMLTNNVTGKHYIGLSVSLRCRLKSHHNMKDRSSSVIHKAIAKYGSCSFTVTVLHRPKAEDLNELEALEIRLRNTLVPNGYNLCLGGKGTYGYKHSEAVRVAQSLRSKGIPKPEGFGKAVAEANKKRWESPDARKAQSAKLLGRVVSDAARLKIAEARRGKPSPKRQAVLVTMHGVSERFAKIEDAAAFLGCTTSAVIGYAKKGTPVSSWKLVDGVLTKVVTRTSRNAVRVSDAIVYE